MLLAADTVYDDDITDAFMAAAAALLQPHATCAHGECTVCGPLGPWPTGCTEAGGNRSCSGGGSSKRMFVALEKR